MNLLIPPLPDLLLGADEPTCFFLVDTLGDIKKKISGKLIKITSSGRNINSATLDPSSFAKSVAKTSILVSELFYSGIP